MRLQAGKRLAAVIRFLWLVGVCAPLAAASGGDPRPADGAESDPAAVEFFEKSVRPLLASRCQGCHGSAKQKGGLRLDSRAAMLKGGSSGPAVVPGDLTASRLIDAIHYGEAVQMPPKSKLPDAEVAALEHWVAIGAPWGHDASSGVAAKAASAAFRAALRERSRFWSFQPIRAALPPSPADTSGWARNPIDRFILDRLSRHGLAPAPEAGRRTLIRRLSFDLTGLPPTRAEVEAFLADRSPDAYERLVDRLLGSPHYGERWGRHWLDLVRYADTAGHEYDYDIPNAFRYRDYVLRALNADLPYDRFLVEHLAGDLLENPRRHPVDRSNESVIATGFLYLGEGVHSPVDVREEEMRRIDNQVDVISKAFLGLTVSCARCHDHKFDPIASRDYYALAGFLHSSRYQQAFIESPGRLGELESCRMRIAELVPSRRLSPVGFTHHTGPPSAAGEVVFEVFNGDDLGDWHVIGDGFGWRPSRDGDFRLDLTPGSGRLEWVAPGQAHSGLLSNRLQGVLRSRTFVIKSRFIHYLAAGRGGTINLVVDGFEKIRDPIYGGLTIAVDAGDRPRWLTQDVGMWLGHPAYIELADGAVADYSGATTAMRDGLGYLAVDEIRMSDRPAPGGSPRGNPTETVDLQAVVASLRSTKPDEAHRLQEAIERFRSIEATIPPPRLAPALADGTGMDEHLLIRGNYRNPGELVPRRFLEVLGGRLMATPASGSGRLELARHLVDPKANPLTPRVLVNRLWKHHFGEGIVKSTDDFGAMGRPPGHPGLLDWLASRLVAGGWSIKAVQRLIVTSSAYRMSSVPAVEAERLDPENVLLHRANVRRLEAEAIRDALLAISGRLDPAMYGPGVPVHLSAFMDGRGRPARSGPLDGYGRRSVYLAVRRNFLNPMFLAFDAPVPFSCIGRRNTSNVPAQALILLNDPFVVEQARRWGHAIASAPARDDRDRIDRAFLAAFGRPPTTEESRACLTFVERSSWSDLCHVLINMKEFIFIQ
jgi:hypothetical protein